MILTLEEVKEYLKIDYDDEDLLLTSLIEVAEQYLYNATGKKFNKNVLAKLYCKVLVYEWYKDRGFTMKISKTSNVSDKTRYTLQSILLQLKYGDDNG